MPPTKLSWNDRDVLILLSCIFLTSIGSFAVIPGYTSHLTKDLTLSMVQVGSIFTANVVAQKGLALIAGYFTDVFDAKYVACTGVALRLVSFLCLGFGQTVASILAAALLSGAGSALFHTAAKAALLRGSGSKVSVMARRGFVINIGVALGPVVGLPLMAISYRAVCFAVAGLFLAVAFFMLTGLRAAGANYRTDRSLHLGEIKKIEFPALMKISINQLYYSFIYTNFELILPLYASVKYGVEVAGEVFIINAVSVIVMQFPVAKAVTRFKTGLQFGFLFFVIAFGLFGLSSVSSTESVWWFRAGIVAFTLGETFMLLQLDLSVADAVRPELIGRALGFLSAFAMVGAGIGNIVLSKFFEITRYHAEQWKFWGILSLCTAVITVFFSIWNSFSVSRQRLNRFDESKA